jgi:hypothetical protein
MKELKELESNYVVEDLICNETRILFILESPHKDEIRYGIPVAGRAGSTMTKVLFQEELPLGRYLKENWEMQKQKQFGIMNVCNIPMQRTAYGETGNNEMHKVVFDAIERVRTSTTKGKFKDEMMNQVQEYIEGNLQQRLDQLKDRKLLVIPCGKFAEKYLKRMVLSDKWVVLWGIPHPSYNSWVQEKYRKQIEQLVLEIQNL